MDDPAPDTSHAYGPVPGLAEVQIYTMSNNDQISIMYCRKCGTTLVTRTLLLRTPVKGKEIATSQVLSTNEGQVGAPADSMVCPGSTGDLGGGAGASSTFGLRLQY